MLPIYERQPSFSENILRGVSGGLHGLAQGGGAIKSALDERRTRNTLAEKYGEAFKNVRDPDLRKQMLMGAIEKENHAAKLKGEYDADEKNYDVMERTFGKRFADVWRAAGQGERTALTNAAIDAQARGIDLDKMLGGSGQKDIDTSDKKSATYEDDYKLDIAGMTPQETVKFKKELRDFNTPIWEKNKNDIKSFAELDRDVKILEGINEKKNLPEGFGKALINPETGAPYDLATVVKDMHPDVQRWVKTIARQATQAQTAFPGRVTNFDLQSYMRQFPSLFNTYEGRKIILKQMDLINKGNILLGDALNAEYNKHKLSGITPEDALDRAEKKIEAKLAKINSEIFALADEGELIAAPEPKSSQGQRVEVYDANGQLAGDIEASEVDQLPPGYRIK